MKKYLTPKNIVIALAVILVAWLLWPKSAIVGLPPVSKPPKPDTAPVVPPTAQSKQSSTPIGQTISQRPSNGGPKREALMELVERVPVGTNKIPLG